MTEGYMGKILMVNLSKGELQDETLDENLCRQFIGGYGLGAKILFDRQKAGVDPLGPENNLGFVTGPFSGTQALGGSRFMVVGKSPLTGTWGDANSGGDFGPYLKFAGYDAVFFTGIATNPVYLLIDNGRAEIKDAAHLWGKDCYETEDTLKGELGADIEVACIGPSGEQVSLISAIITQKGRAAARSGLGAVMGAKKLKAVVAKGKMEIPVFDADKVIELRRKYIRELTGDYPVLNEFGTSGFVVFCSENGITPVKNWAGVGVVDFPNAKNIGGDRVIAQQQRKYGCYHCVLACGGHMKEGTGEYEYAAGCHKPEYETLGMFGTNCLNDNLESIIKANDICNRYGLDTLSAASCIAYTIDCYENGVISKEDTGGIEMTWGNHKSIITMLEKIANREGIGDVLADGVKIASEKIGKGSEKYAMHIQGQEYPARDPRQAYAMASCFKMDATPGRHMQFGGLVSPGLPLPKFDPNAWTGRGEAQKIGTCFNHVVDSAGCCQIISGTYPDVGVFIEFLNAITGWDYTMNDVLKAGERIKNIRHVFNLREGLNPLKFKSPDRILGKPPLEEGPLKGVTVDDNAIARELCEALDWDLETTRPSDKKLKELGLEYVAEAI